MLALVCKKSRNYLRFCQFQIRMVSGWRQYVLGAAAVCAYDRLNY